MVLAMRLIWGFRVVLAGVIFALFILQYEPRGELSHKKIQFKKVGRSGYAALYLVAQDGKHAILYTDDKVDLALSRLNSNDDIDAMVRPGGGVVELRVNGELIYSRSDYHASKSRDKEIGFWGVIAAGFLLIISFFYKGRAR